MADLAEALWGADPPPSARNTIQGYVKNLRKSLGTLSGRLATRSPGYLIEVDSGELDLDEFTALRDQASRAADSGDWAQAAHLYARALGLWPGEPLPDVGSEYLRRTELPRLSELRQSVLEARIDADLRTGEHQAIVAELRGLVAAHPLRERLTELLMLALYRSGRQGEALEEYQQAVYRLREELGIDPGPRLRKLHAQVLTADAGLDLEQVCEPPRVPRQLPAGLPDFTGREACLARLRDVLLQPARTPGAVPVAVLTGPGGIGKTALALHVAHDLASYFPDGQIFLRLGGATDPARPADLLGRVLRELGTAALPAGEDERAALLRTTLAHKAMLLVLDDAHTAAQVRHLLPGGGGSSVIITSRSALPDLAGASFHELSVLNSRESANLLAAIAGECRDPDGVESILSACGGLPLAIRIAGSRLATNPAWSAAQLGTLLACERERLGELAVGDTAVRSAFEVSYRALPAGAAAPAQVFRLFGLASLRSVSTRALAAMAGRPVDDDVRMLLDVHLLESPVPGRLTAHDLLRIYAGERAADSDTEAGRRDALGRLFAWYMHGLIVSQEYLGGVSQSLEIEPPELEYKPVVADVASWLEAEAANLSQVVTLAYGTGHYEDCWRLAWLLRYYLDWSGRWSDDHTVAASGVHAARACGNTAAEAALLNVLGTSAFRLGNLPASIGHLTQALRLRRELADERGTAESLCNLGLAELRSGLTSSAITRFTQALRLNLAAENLFGASYCLHNLGAAHKETRQIPVALGYFRQALDMRVRHASQFEQAASLHSLGELLVESGSVDEGMELLHKGLLMARDNKLRYIEGMTLLALGDGRRLLGDHAQARSSWQEAFEILTLVGSPAAQQASDRL